MQVTLRPLPSGVTAELVTPDGVLRGPDHGITITDCMLAVAGIGDVPVAVAQEA